MKYVNEDMDDIFRKAGQEYPLRTDTANWDKVASVLYPGYKKYAPVKDGRRYLWLLILLPVPWLCSYYLFSGREEVKNTATAMVKRDRSVSGYAETQVKLNKLHNSVSTIAPSAFSDYNKTVAANYTSNNQTKKNTINAVIVSIAASGKQPQQIISGNEPDKDAAINESYSLHGEIESLKTKLDQPVSFELPPISGVESFSSFGIPQKSNAKILAAGGRKVSFGILGGMDATTIKFQKLDRRGFNMGLFAGIDITKHWTIEVGFLTTKKYYFTKGKEFNKTELYMPANIEIISVDGSCQMTEVPIVARYHFNTAHNYKWFFAAGVSSFFMRGENYNYEVLYAATGQHALHSKTYDHASSSLLSVAQLSTGLTVPVGKTFHFRAEPYLQIPLKGLGIGQLPLTSGGIRLAVYKKLF